MRKGQRHRYPDEDVGSPKGKVFRLSVASKGVSGIMCPFRRRQRTIWEIA